MKQMSGAAPSPSSFARVPCPYGRKQHKALAGTLSLDFSLLLNQKPNAQAQAELLKYKVLGVLLHVPSHWLLPSPPPLVLRASSLELFLWQPSCTRGLVSVALGRAWEDENPAPHLLSPRFHRGRDE